MPILTLLRAKWFLGIIAVLLVLSNFTYIAYLRRENARLKTDLTRTSEALYQCSQENQALSNELTMQIRKYQAKVRHLLKLANRPHKVIKVPKIIVKKIYITSQECQQMAIMIDEFIRLQKREER